MSETSIQYLKEKLGVDLNYTKKYISMDETVMEYADSFEKSEVLQFILLPFMTELQGYYDDDKLDIIFSVIKGEKYINKLISEFHISQLFNLDPEETEDERESGEIEGDIPASKPTKLLFEVITMLVLDCSSPLLLKPFFEKDIEALKKLSHRSKNKVTIENVRTVLKRKVEEQSLPVTMKRPKFIPNPIVEQAEPDPGKISESSDIAFKTLCGKEVIFKDISRQDLELISKYDPAQALNVWSQKESCGAAKLEVSYKMVGAMPNHSWHCQLKYKGVLLATAKEKNKNGAKKIAAAMALHKIEPEFFPAVSKG